MILKKELYNILSSGMAGHGCWVDSKTLLFGLEKNVYSKS